MGEAMKTLTVKQPWAGLIVTGLKDIENRTWKTNYRGKLLIHASKAYNKKERIETEDFICRNILTKGELSNLRNDDGTIRHYCGEYGTIIGEVELIDCVRNHSSNWAEKDVWNWVLANPIKYDTPIEVKGKLGLWEYEKESENLELKRKKD